MYGDQIHPKTGSVSQYPHRYGYHPHGSLETHVHPYGEIHTQRPYTYGDQPTATRGRHAYPYVGTLTHSPYSCSSLTTTGGAAPWGPASS